MIRVRPGEAADVDAVLALFDAAQRWLAANGRSGQWGTEPFSTNRDQARQFRDWAINGQLRIAEIDATPVGAVVIGVAPNYAPRAVEPELYLQGFVSDRDHRGHGIGAALIEAARAEAVQRGIGLLRLDCWAGGDGKLVRYYERAGFTRGETFTVGSWPGQLLTRCV
ncbi:MAG TPA: GNAT family N-acetyltransferase [Micromonosporaceae bacterium]|jgi:GNAT superfamily N-acetyltransferase